MLKKLRFLRDKTNRFNSFEMIKKILQKLHMGHLAYSMENIFTHETPPTD